MLILEANTAGSAIVNTVEIFNGGHNGVSGIMGKDLHSHWYPCSNFGVFIQQKLEGNILGDRVIGGLLVRSRIPTVSISVSMIVRRGGVPLSSSRLLMLYGLHR